MKSPILFWFNVVLGLVASFASIYCYHIDNEVGAAVNFVVALWCFSDAIGELK